MQDVKAKPFAQRAIDDHARVSAIFPSQFARRWLTVGLRGTSLASVPLEPLVGRPTPRIWLRGVASHCVVLESQAAKLP